MLLHTKSTMSLRLAVFGCLLAAAFAVPADHLHNSLRIVGAQEAYRGEFPHQVSVQWQGRHQCGGSIINDRWILTTGSCVPPNDVVTVKAGKHYMFRNEDSEQISRVLGGGVFIHKKFSGATHPYDIALLKLETPLRFGRFVQPISLPQAESSVSGSAVLSGWGATTAEGKIMPDALRKVALPIISLESCKSALVAINGRADLAVSNVCTGPLSGGVSPCNADGGSPLIKYNNGRNELVGLVAWGVLPCGTFGAPAVYTKVSSFIDWIELTIDAHRKMDN